MNKQEFVDFLSTKKNPCFISFVREVRNQKGVSEFTRVEFVTANFNRKYGNAKRRLMGGNPKKDGPAPVEPRRWGQHITNGLIENNGKHYLNLIDPKVSKCHYFKDGRQISAQEYWEVIGTKKKTDEPIKVRAYSIDNILKFKGFGKEVTL